MIRLVKSLTLALVFTIPATLVAADPVAPQEHRASCFYSDQFEGWKAPDSRTLYIRVRPTRYYRLDLASPCSALLWPGSFLLTEIHGTNSVCTALDWDLQVVDEPHGIPEACIVRAMTELSPAEAAAIPRKFKP
jgi:hypothetical protein